MVRLKRTRPADPVGSWETVYLPGGEGYRADLILRPTNPVGPPLEFRLEGDELVLRLHDAPPAGEMVYLPKDMSGMIVGFVRSSDPAAYYEIWLNRLYLAAGDFTKSKQVTDQLVNMLNSRREHPVPLLERVQGICKRIDESRQPYGQFFAEYCLLIDKGGPDEGWRGKVGARATGISAAKKVIEVAASRGSAWRCSFGEQMLYGGTIEITPGWTVGSLYLPKMDEDSSKTPTVPAYNRELEEIRTGEYFWLDNRNTSWDPRGLNTCGHEEGVEAPESAFRFGGFSNGNNGGYYWLEPNPFHGLDLKEFSNTCARQWVYAQMPSGVYTTCIMDHEPSAAQECARRCHKTEMGEQLLSLDR